MKTSTTQDAKDSATSEASRATSQPDKIKEENKEREKAPKPKKKIEFAGYQRFDLSQTQDDPPPADVKMEPIESSASGQPDPKSPFAVEVQTLPNGTSHPPDKANSNGDAASSPAGPSPTVSPQQTPQPELPANFSPISSPR